MSHEIRTPMNGVIGMLRQILNDSLPEKQKERAEIAQSSATSLLTLINDILDFSKIEAGKLSLEKTDFNLKDVIIETIRSFNATAEEKGLELKTDFSCVSRHHFIGDPGRIRQILVNLIGNALKFTEEGYVLISADCSETEDGDWIFTCSVKDSGIGIPEEKLDILFNSFTQVDASTTRKFGGTGLGLAISNQLSRLMGGGVSVESELGKGSRFTFTVRLEASEFESETESGSIQASDKDAMDDSVENEVIAWPKEAHVLLVEDHMVNMIVAEGLMEEFGLTYETAENGAIAIERLKESQQDGKKSITFVLMDCEMPEVDGYEATRTN